MSITPVSAQRGLTAAEVDARVAAGQTNDVPQRTSRSAWDIVRANVFTRINALLAVLLVVVLVAGSALDGLFGFIIIVNSGIGIVQELRAKRTLDRLAILARSEPIVRRDGVAAPLDPARVVLDDIIEIGAGDQLLVDGVLVETSGLEIDESLLTGEAEPVDKPIGATVLSGSFVASGSGAYRATHVGRDAYSVRLAEEARKFTLVHSELRAGIDSILRLVTWLILPAGILIICSQLFASGEPLRPALVGTVAALVPMIPEGLVLMTSIAFALGVIRLGQMQCLVQELPAIEGLARVDVVCIDKTGTLTEPGMSLGEIIALDGADPLEARAALAALAGADPRPNGTILAIRDGLPDAGWGPATAIVPFSSARKWQGRSCGEHGSWLLGAPDVLLDPASDAARRAGQIAARGLRVLLLARTDALDPTGRHGAVSPQLLVVLNQKLRPDAAATLAYFASQGVAIKVISGDNPESVGAVAMALGLPGGDAPVDARTLPADREQLADRLESATTFGRVRPEQKRAMVAALQARGHVVAMTGDGVNDVLALKDADIGVAMGSGSPATRAVAQIVLLDSRFASLPSVVGEGRRVLGNIERVSNLFLTKTVYSAILALVVGLSGVLALFAHAEPLPFPFLPRHITIAGWFTIGIPAFLLSLAPNNERARSGFVTRVRRQALPSGIIVAVATFACYLLVSESYGLADADKQQSGTAALITLIIVMLRVLALVSRPYEWWKLALLAGCIACYAVLFGLPLTRTIFALDVSNPAALTVALACGAAGLAALEVAWRVFSPR